MDLCLYARVGLCVPQNARPKYYKHIDLALDQLPTHDYTSIFISVLLLELHQVFLTLF